MGTESIGDYLGPPWTAQVNDLIGGAVVTTYPHPLSEHDHRKDGDPHKRGYVIAECMTMADAERIAGLLNGGEGPSTRLPCGCPDVGEDFLDPCPGHVWSHWHPNPFNALREDRFCFYCGGMETQEIDGGQP